MRFEAYYFKSFTRVKSIQEVEVRLILGNELKLTQVELFSLFYFNNVQFDDLFLKFIFNAMRILSMSLKLSVCLSFLYL